MSFDIAIIFFISLVLMWVKPGPAQLLKITTTLDRGFLQGILISLGSILVCCFFFIIAAMGYKALSEIFQYTGKVLQLFGGVYLSYLAYKSFRKISNGNTKVAENSKLVEKDIFGYFAAGVLITLSNPFWLFYFIGILPTLLPLESFTISSFQLGILLVFMSGIIVDGPMLLLVSQIQKSFSSEKINKGINIFISFSFLVIALFLFYSAFFVEQMSFNIVNQ